MEKIFFSPKNKEYYTDERQSCHFCSKMSGFNFLVTFSKKDFFAEYIYCDKCVKQIPENQFLIKTVKMVVYTNILPKDCIPIFDNVVDTGFGRGDLTIFDVANKQIGNEKIVDKTVYANRESFEGISIGKIDYEKLKAQDKIISFKEAKRLM